MRSHFNSRNNANRLTPEQAARQGDATKRALAVLPSAEAIAFLNGFDADLGGRPIDLAVESAGGLAAVETAIARLAPRAAGAATA